MMKKLIQIGAAIKTAESVITSFNSLRAQFNGKSPAEAKDFMVKNLASLKSPETFQNLQKVLMGQNPMDVAKLIMNAKNSFTMDDAMKLAAMLTDDKMDEKLPKYLEDKIRNPNPITTPLDKGIQKWKQKRKK